ncbi:hypothetical protein D9M68_912680 [compost metagenome]
MSAASRASASTSSAREVLTNSAVGFMRERSSSLTRPWVSSLSRRCTDSTSAAAKNSWRFCATWKPSERALAQLASRPQITTCMPKACP